MDDIQTSTPYRKGNEDNYQANFLSNFLNSKSSSDIWIQDSKGLVTINLLFCWKTQLVFFWVRKIIIST